MLHPTFRCGRVCGLAIGLTLAALGPTIAGDKDLAVIQDLYAKRDLIALQRLNNILFDKMIVSWNKSQCDQVALLLAPNLEIDSVLQGAKFDKFFDYLNRRENDKVREHWGMNST